jgi:hypothetical protein
VKRFAVATVALFAVTFVLGTSVALAGQQGPRSHTKSVVLQGTVNASETRLMSNPDVGALYKWNGKGTLKPLGHVAGKGGNHGVGFTQAGTPTGTMTLSNGTGSISLKITYDQTRGFAPLPSHGTYVITGGTGAYAGATGKGTVLRKQGACPSGSTCGIGATFPVAYQFSGAGAKKGKKHH